MNKAGRLFLTEQIKYDQHTNRAIAGTFTFKKRFNFKYIDDIDVEEATRHFKNRINQSALKNDYCRRGRQLKFLYAIEKMADGRLHIHTYIECPDEMNTDDFCKIIESCWRKIDIGHRSIDLQNCYDKKGWISYMTKRSETKTGV